MYIKHVNYAEGTHEVQNSTETLQQLEAAFDDVKEKLFTELHQVVREQIFPPVQNSTLQLPVNATPPQDGMIGSRNESPSIEMAAVVEEGSNA